MKGLFVILAREFHRDGVVAGIFENLPNFEETLCVGLSRGMRGQTECAENENKNGVFHDLSMNRSREQSLFFRAVPLNKFDLIVFRFGMDKLRGR